MKQPHIKAFLFTRQIYNHYKPRFPIQGAPTRDTADNTTLELVISTYFRLTTARL